MASIESNPAGIPPSVLASPEPDAPAARGRGRRRGSPDTRDVILQAGRTCFIELGYRGASVRQIADRAGVDSRLIAYHFGSKRGLFAQAMTLPLSPSEVFMKALSGPPHTWSVGILSGTLAAWDDPKTGLPLRRLLTAALNDEELRRAVTEFVERELRDALTERLEAQHVPQAGNRATATVTVIIGAILSRYILGIQPISTLSREKTIEVLRPVLDAALHVKPGRTAPVPTRDIATRTR